jgi:hypothetical protein
VTKPDKLDAWRKRERTQAALDLREVLRTPAGRRVIARLLLKAGTYGSVLNKRDAARREFGLALERDILRVGGEQAWVELQHIRLTELLPHVVHSVDDAADS